MSDLLRKLIHRAELYPVVAFDVFDTLIYRDLDQPTDLFDWLEITGRAPQGFAAERKAAEHRARADKPHEEITLEEIYNGGCEGASASAECEAELRVVTPNPPLLRFCKELRAAGKRLYAISDMYLPAAQIEAMLAKCGYPAFDGVYVSSTYGVQKRSGKLFATFLENERLAARDVLFVGDDRRADSTGSALVGISSVLLPKRRNTLRYTLASEGLPERAYRAFTQNRMIDAGHEEAIGLEILSPILIGFATWLHARCEERPQGKLILLARDMYLTRAAYERLFPEEETGYLKASRRSLCPALLLSAEDGPARELLLDALPREVLTAREIADFCGFNEAEALKNGLSLQSFDLRRRPAPREIWGLLDTLFSAARGPQGTEVRRQAELTNQYLMHSGIMDEGAILVDIGSGGTTQRALEEITGKTLHGCYLACDERLHEHLPPERAETYLFGGQPAPLWFWMGQPLLEYLISEPCGATVGYCLGADGFAHPCVADGVPSPVVKKIQAGALYAVTQWYSTLPWPEPVLSSERAIAPFLKLVRAPKLRDAALMGNFVLEDGIEYRLAAPQRLGRYLCHPSEFKHDFMGSHWKVAFLKRLLKVPAPYDKLYALLKGC